MLAIVMCPKGKRLLYLIGSSVLFLCLAQSGAYAKQMALIVNAKNDVHDLPETDLVNIFKCVTQKWADGTAIKLVLRDPSSPEMEMVLWRVYKLPPDEVRKFVAAHRDSIIVVDSSEAMLNAVQSTPGAIGLIDVFLINKQIKVVKIDGKLPVEYGYILRGN
jgi:ABC-type phosphate transport system substrate-binding protein